MIDEISRLDDEYYDERLRLIKEFILLKLDYWKQIPLLTYIEHGMGGYGEVFNLFTDKIYSINYSSEYVTYEINCMTGEFLNDSRYDSIMYLEIDSIDAEQIVASLNKSIDYSLHNDYNCTEPQDYVLGSIKNDIPLTYLDYNRHYKDSKYTLTENAFNYFKNTITKDYCLEILTK